MRNRPYQPIKCSSAQSSTRADIETWAPQLSERSDAHIHLVATPTISAYAHFHRQPTLEDLRAKLHRRARDAALNATDATLLAVRESEWEAKAR